MRFLAPFAEGCQLPNRRSRAGVPQTIVCRTHGSPNTAEQVFFADVDEVLLFNVGFRAYSGRPPC